MSSRFILFYFLLSIILVLKAQEVETDTTKVVRKIIPSIYIDYGKLLTIPLANETKYEGGIELLFKEKIPFILEIGSATLTPSQVYSNGTYEAKGKYFRIGSGIYSQFLPKNKIGFTGRYATSTFDEEATLSTEAPINLDRTLSESFQRKSLSATWFELLLYTDVKINGFLVIGMNLRYRYLLNYDLQSPDDVYAIPGYGRSFDQSIPAANLFLKVSF